MLNLICKELNNWFDTKRHIGKFTITDGQIDGFSLQEGQYFRIVGSVFNDGVYEYPATELKDEVFNGGIWEMAIPKEVIELSTEIENWNKNNTSVLNSPYQSESFGGYSYTKKSSTNGGDLTWQSQFASQLNQWRKVRCRY